VIHDPEIVWTRLNGNRRTLLDRIIRADPLDDVSFLDIPHILCIFNDPGGAAARVPARDFRGINFHADANFSARTRDG
jgi:hypothetical protein